jgi:hypothetical protein
MASETYFYSDCATLDVNCYLKYWNGSSWVDAEDVSGVVDGKFSDGTYCYTVANGVITSKVSCQVNLLVYANHIGSNSHDLEYKINTGSWTSMGAAFSGCNLLTTLYSLNIGDTVYFRESFGPWPLSGSTTTCPSSAICYDTTEIYISGELSYYLTVDTSGVAC